MATPRFLRLFTLLLFAAACKPDSGKFVGAWRYSSGNIDYTCGSSLTHTQLAGDVIISVGSQSDLSAAFTNEACTLEYDFPSPSDSAQLKAGQTCSVFLYVQQPSQGSLSLSGGALIRTEKGNLLVAQSTCPYSIQASLSPLPDAGP